MSPPSFLRPRTSLATAGAIFLGASLISCLRPDPTAPQDEFLVTPPVLTLFYDSSIARFTNPLWFGEFPDEPETFAVAELGGDIKLLHVDSAQHTTIRAFAHVPVFHAPYTNGLLGVAFHPDFTTNRKYYVYYTSGPGEVRLAERMASSQPATDAEVERELLSLPTTPYAHFGGDLRFGPDGMLYLGVGDGATGGGLLPGERPFESAAQSLTTLYGKIIRIDVNRSDSGLPYGIPPDNPFATNSDSGIRKEIWAYGLRQPWRGSFDPVDGRLLIGDVGLIHSEEINVVQKGGNYGWRRVEGARTCVNDSTNGFWRPLPDCDKTGLTPPLVEFRREPPYPALSIIGGHVFRGDTASPHYGAYLFGVSETGAIHYLPAARQQDPGQPTDVIAHASANIGAFGTDSKGNLYTVEYEAGIIRRIDHPELRGKLSPSN